ncbi:RNA 2',3'-cyclic phosphodiesterase [Pontibacter silvestris]|uniref:RNA 2',3'-cyclic phosphodiesterase n=1 Tax=Pontibacter silvestris TaxID=2305183 RepID=A0ABW4WTY6_9BACT|nr:RNA 2',3'-cyclic phosphodiesterase [Pontibacter silvestris]MCC9138580.1 RNA 2',3'-cyclic phosphodiesterase [Pontibacter silvestris]
MTQEEIRLFVAATLPSPLKVNLQEQLQPFLQPAVRAVPLDNLHLTLFFIGNVPQQELPAIKQALAEVTKRHAPFTLFLASTEAGPNAHSPRLIWARFQQHQAFEALSHDLVQALATEPPKKQKAIPHVTMARFRKGQPTPKRLPALVPEHDYTLEVNSIALWQSTLTSPHPVYTVLETYTLG